MSHSKRNTSRAVFTSHERDLARKAWSSTSARLTRESFLSFAACRLCLETARDPVSCTHGDIFCRECALENILAQKKEIKRQGRLRETEARESDEQKALQDAEARERAVREFELTQNGLDVRAGAEGKKKAAPTIATAGWYKQNSRTPAQLAGVQGKEGSGAESAEATPTAVVGGSKRKFEMDSQELARIATEDRAKARKALDDERDLARDKLPSFWVPSITPSSNTHDTLHEVARKQKSTPVCPASREDDPHTYSLHTLVTVAFTTEEEDQRQQQQRDGGRAGSDETSGKNKTTTTTRICPACKKGLTNASRAALAKPCGHVVCGSCVDKFMRPSASRLHHDVDPHADHHDGHDDPSRVRCYVCEADLTESGGGAGGDSSKKDEDEAVAVAGKKTGKGGDKERSKKERIKPGLVELRSEGTGFSAGGASQVRKSGVSFQC